MSMNDKPRLIKFLSKADIFNQLNIVVTKNFKLYEFFNTVHYDKQFHPFNLSEEIAFNCLNSIILLQHIRDAINMPIIINSGFRSNLVNIAVGGVESSLHQFGTAFDVKISTDIFKHKFCLYLDSLINSRLLQSTYPNLKYIVYNSYIHVQYHTAKEYYNYNLKHPICSTYFNSVFYGKTKTISSLDSNFTPNGSQSSIF